MTIIKVLKILSSQMRQTPICAPQHLTRFFSDKGETPSSKTRATPKQVESQGSESEERLRVRRARAADVPRVLRYVQEHAHAAWPGVPPPRDAVSYTIFSDYVSRALAQGHSMLAEQLETKKGWSHIRGLALAASMCPWDASMIDRWSKCVACPRSRQLMQFTAHCLRAPALHDKYNVHNILQVMLFVPHNHPKYNDIVLNLLKSSLERGRKEGFPLLRFDVTNNTIAQLLEELQLKKEWELTFNSSTLLVDSGKRKAEAEGDGAQGNNFIAVYSIEINKKQESE